jgi:hypothetical protein
LPYFTAIGALALCLIELKSIYEKAEDKVKMQIGEVGSFAGSLIRNGRDMEAILSEIAKYLKKEDETKS